MFLFFRSAAQFAGINTPVTSPSSPLAIPASGYAQAAPCFALGVVIWTLLEYTLHRFLFHVDEWLPDHPAFLTLHFLLHGVHHYLPMDRYVPLLGPSRATLTPSFQLALGHAANPLLPVVVPIHAVGLRVVPHLDRQRHYFRRLRDVYVSIISLDLSGSLTGTFRCRVRLHALCSAPHPAPRVHARDEEVPSCSPLQEL